MNKFSYFGLNHLMVRIIACVALVLITYNPYGNSIYHWFVIDLFSYVKIKIFLITLGASSLYFIARIIYSNSGILGVTILLSMVSISLYELHYRALEWSLGQLSFIFLAEVVFAIYLAIALSAPHIVTRLSGQTQKRYLGL